jgi:hypothetical protein
MFPANTMACDKPDELHQAMCHGLCRCIANTIEIARNLPSFFIVVDVDVVVAHNRSNIT